MKHFLGRGVAFPLGTDAYGKFKMGVHEDSVAQSVQIILGTAVGERVMQPHFGCRIHDLIFHPVTPNTCAMVSMYVRDALSKWEPRIQNIEVRSFPDPDQDNRILISIDYRIRTSNKMTNLVYPFFLRREQDL